MSPRVAVNLMWCVPGDVGGSEQYLVRQLLGLAEIGAADDVVVYGPLALASAHPRLVAAYPFVPAPIDGRRRWRRVVAESRWLHHATARAGLVHHGGGTAPLRARRPYVLTIHDLQHRTFPHYVSRAKRAYLDAVVPRSARNASLITVPSEYVRQSVVDHLGVDADRVAVVPHGYEPALLDEITPESELRARLSLGDAQVLVYPAMTAPHKNHAFLLDLMLDEWSATDHRLVLLGGRGLAADDVAARVADPRLRGRVTHAGRVSDADRNGLLAMAEALVFPSEYEGFGAPLIEAMALGTPIICSDSTCLPAVVGDAGIVLPLARDAWRGALADAHRDRERLVAAGLARATEFTAAASGRALAAVYDRANG